MGFFTARGALLAKREDRLDEWKEHHPMLGGDGVRPPGRQFWYSAYTSRHKIGQRILDLAYSGYGPRHAWRRYPANLLQADGTPHPEAGRLEQLAFPMLADRWPAGRQMPVRAS